MCLCACVSPCLGSLMSGLSFLIRPVWCFSSEWRRVTSQCKASYVCCMLLSLQEDGTFHLNIIIIKELVVAVVRNIQLSDRISYTYSRSYCSYSKRHFVCICTFLKLRAMLNFQLTMNLIGICKPLFIKQLTETAIEAW